MSALIRPLFHSLETIIHERLAMIEDIISGLSLEKRVGENNTDLLKKILEIEKRIISLEKSTVNPVTSASSTVWIDALKDLEIVLPTSTEGVTTVSNEKVVKLKEIIERADKEEAEAEEAALEAEEADEEEADEEEADEEEAALEAEEADEEEAIEEEVVEEETDEEEVVEEETVEEDTVEEETNEEEVEEIEFKGKKYYRDSNQNIYSTKTEEIIGIWDVARGRVLFKRPL
uniref:Uncharacterized protein n=1 Tax=viral metagenome TaxID=1070528 RepID=A0A6C0K3T7_9ZZZZ